MRKYNLAYYVYAENINKRKIEKYNVLNDGFLEQVKKRCIECDVQDKNQFSGHVEALLMNNYWCRSEWETILTSWPTHMSFEELQRLNRESARHIETYHKEPCSVTVSLKVEEKIDVYDQVMMNWDIFIDYFWSNFQKEIIRRNRSERRAGEQNEK